MPLANHRGLTRFLPQSALLFGGMLLCGCGPDFDPPDQLSSLRILGVEKDVPYAKPGETVTLKMLWEDASPNAGRPIQIAWSGPCFDPLGDVYYNCFSQPSVVAGLAQADSTSVLIPTDVISRRPAQTTAENNAPYGLTFVFFAACAGTLTPIPTTDVTAFPLGCKDDTGKLLGSEDFVAGYTSIYSFDKFTNNNPVISGFALNGTPIDPSNVCIGDSCLPIAEASTVPPIDCTGAPLDQRCIPTCSDDGKKPCPAYAIRPTVDKNDPNNQDQDDVSVMQLGHPVGEQMWIDYYTDGGGFKSPVRLLNDATTGWNDDYGTDFYASKDAKASRVWALVHDNRGGVAWAGITIQTY